MPKPYSYLKTMEKGPTQFRIDRYKMYEKFCTKGIHGNVLKQYLIAKLKSQKVTKTKLSIMPKPHAYLQTITKRPKKSQIDWYKTV